LLIAGPSDAARHLTGRLFSLPLNLPFDSPLGVRSQVFSAGKGFGIPRSYTPPPALSRNDSFGHWRDRNMPADFTAFRNPGARLLLERKAQSW